MLKTKRQRSRFAFFLGIGLLSAILVIGFLVYRSNRRPRDTPEAIWGVTWSKTYAESFGLDARSAYLAVLDELGVKNIRLPVYWNDVEPSPKVFRYQEYDWMLKEAEKREVKIILAIGRKLPRWPECHTPLWAEKLKIEEQELKLLGSLQATVKHFRASPAIVYWQVENEALFPFGLCPKPSPELLKKEVDIVHSLDSRPVVITDSGELSTWNRAADIGDILGVSMYRVAWNNFFGYFYFPIPPSYYRRKAEAVTKYASKIIVTELQAEPWGRLPLTELPLKEQYQSMNLVRFRSNINFARKTGLPEIYLWGVEWWYWLKEKHGNAVFWEEAKKLFK